MCEHVVSVIYSIDIGNDENLLLLSRSEIELIELLKKSIKKRSKMFQEMQRVE